MPPAHEPAYGLKDYSLLHRFKKRKAPEQTSRSELRPELPTPTAINPPAANVQYWFGYSSLSALSQSGKHNARLAYELSKAEPWFSSTQAGCLDDLWWHENKFETGNGGIPQAKPESKMASEGEDYLTNPVTQEKWGLKYIQQTYGTPCGAWDTWQSRTPPWY